MEKAAKKKSAAKKVSPRKSVSSRSKSALKPVGVATHFYGQINVGIFKFKKPVKVGAEIFLRGATTDFSQKIESMQFDHAPITLAKKGQEVGIKVKKKVHEGDHVFLK